MAEQNKQSTEPAFQLNYATIILLLVIIIPLGYTIVANLQAPPPAPVITPAANNSSSQSSSQNSSNGTEAALKAVVDNPNYNSYTGLGLTYYQAGKYDDAIKAWEKALTYNPKSELAYNNIAAAYGALNKWDEEIDACEKALAINPKFDLARRNMEWAKGKKAGK